MLSSDESEVSLSVAGVFKSMNGVLMVSSVLVLESFRRVSLISIFFKCWVLLLI